MDEPPTESQQYLRNYLNTHRAGASAGTALARRIWHNNRSGPWASELKDIFVAIQVDKGVLDEIRSAAGVKGGRLSRVGAMVLERTSRLGHIAGYTPLIAIIELEALMSGVQARQRLWSALRAATPFLSNLDAFDFPTLELQAAEQLKTLGEIHTWTAARCFSVGGADRMRLP